MRKACLRGLFLYAAMLGFYVLAVVPTGKYVGWNPTQVLIFAPLSGISQELFFRAALLPVLLWVLSGRLWLALILHTSLFGLWHIGVLLTGATLLEAIPVIMVPAVFGVLWGWQVVRDRTILWSVAHHTLLLVINTFYTWG